MTKPDLKYLPIDKLIPNGWNPQTQDEATFNRLVDEVKENGCLVPVQVVALTDGNFRIIGGEHRWKACQQAGLDEVPAAVLTGKKWEDADLQKFETVRLNAIGGKLDPEKFAKLYNELADKYGRDSLQQMFGFSDTRIFQKLVGDIKRQVKKSLPKEMHAAVDAAAKEAKTFQDLTDIVQMMLAKHGDTMNQSFMVFTFGNQEHVYVQMDRKMKRSLDKVLNYCRESGADINAFLGPIMDEAAKRAAKALKSGASSDAAEPDAAEPDVLEAEAV
jgi:hypothetical protein